MKVNTPATSSASSSYLELYSGYFGHLSLGDPNTEFISVTCPFHEDSHASAGISKTSGVFNCHLCGSFSPAQFLHKMTGMDIDDAYRHIDMFRSEHGLVTKTDNFVKHLPAPNPKWEDMYRRSQELITPDLHIVQEYMNARGLRYETLVQGKVGFLPKADTNWKRDSLVFPYIFNGKVVGLRYRDAGMNKGAEAGCHFTLWHIDDLDDAGDVVVMFEGETDHLVGMQALKGRYTVTSAPSNVFRHEWIREFDGIRQLILIKQADKASEDMARAAREAISTITVLTLPWRRKQSGKDTADWLRYHEEQELLDLVDSVAEASTRRVVTGHEFKAMASQPRRWLIQGFLARRQVGLIGGPPKAHKTWMAMNIIRTLLSREPLCGIPSLIPLPDEPIPNILIIEEEGDIEGLKERVDMVLDGQNWEDHTFWGHHLGVKLDTDVWIQRLEADILQYKIDLLIIDPFHRTYDVDEDKASEMGHVWNRINILTTRFKDLSIIILHHFNKGGGVEAGWGSFRGSNRTAAEADLGCFMEARAKSKGGGARLKIEGRSIPSPTTSDGKDVFDLEFHHGILKVPEGKVGASKGGTLYERVKNEGEILVTEAATLLSVSISTIETWVRKSLNAVTGDPLMIIDGRPKMVRLYVPGMEDGQAEAEAEKAA